MVVGLFLWYDDSWDIRRSTCPFFCFRDLVLFGLCLSCLLLCFFLTGWVGGLCWGYGMLVWCCGGGELCYFFLSSSVVMLCEGATGAGVPYFLE